MGEAEGKRRGPPRGGRKPGRGPGRGGDGPRDYHWVEPDVWTPRGEAKVSGGHELLVWQGIPGERARVRVVHRGQNQDRALWQRADRPHPSRVEPPCERYHPCGGCPLMHVDQAGQLEARRVMVADALAAEGLGEVAVEPVVAAPSGADYRHLIKLGVGYSDRRHPRLGAFGRDTRQIVPIPGCPVTTPALREVMKVTAFQFINLDIRPFVPGRGGLLRYVVARQSAHTDEVLITLVGARNHKLLRELADAIEANCAAVVGVHLHINDGPGNAIFARDGQGVVGTRRLAGRGHIIERLAGVDYTIGPGDFFQTHPAVADRLYRDVIEEISGAANGVPVVDLYSGVGGFALALAPRTGWALGVEAVEGAVLRARESASAAEVAAEFTQGDVAEVLPDIARRLKGKRPLVIVDPARRGLEEGVFEGIEALKPRRVVYVSCNPRSLARDMRRFVDAGWSVGAVRPYDMFPHTAHVEVVVALDPPDADAIAEATTARAPRRKLVR